MRVVHILRKCHPAEWGGTETAIQRLFEGLRQHDVASVVYCPRLYNGFTADPLTDAGCVVKRFRAFLPVWGISRKAKQQLISVGGNLMSFDLFGALAREPGISVIHTHALGRLGGIASAMGRQRGIPFVVTIHGGLLDVPDRWQNDFHKPGTRGLDWGKVFGAVLQSRRLLDHADAILTCNPRESALLHEQHPGKRILVQPHGVAIGECRTDHRETARAAFPQLRGRHVLLSVGRIDPIKNQAWLLEQAPAIFQKHPAAMLVLAGAVTDERYGQSLKRQISALGLENRVLLTGGLPPGDPRLIGLLQDAKVAVLASISETFGLVILEAWAAGTPVIASRTSGASALLKHGQNGWLFDLADPGLLHSAVDQALLEPRLAAQFAAAGRQLVSAEYDATVLAGRMKTLYEQLIEEKHALRHSSR